MNSNLQGINYAATQKPTSILLTVPADGMNARAAETAILKHKNVGNAWDVVSAEYESRKKMHNAHQKAYESVDAGIRVAQSYVNANTSWYGYQSALATQRIAKSQARVDIASVPLAIEKQNAELEIKRSGVEKAKLELERSLRFNSQLRQDLDHEKTIGTINAYVVDVSLPSLIQGISGIGASSSSISGEL